MASFQGHIRFSTALGVAYGGLAWHQLQVQPATAAIGGLLTAMGGMLPDLDSDSGVPVRETFGLAAMLVPAFLLRSFSEMHLSHEEALLAMVGCYFAIRFGVRGLFRRITVHRGMYHSLPAMGIVGLVVFLLSRQPNPYIRGYYAVGTMLGFFSHLLLDEFCAVDFRGLTVKTNQFAGTAVKLWGPSWGANVFTYTVLISLGYAAYLDMHPADKPLPQVRPAAPASTHLQEQPQTIQPPPAIKRKMNEWTPAHDSPGPHDPNKLGPLSMPPR